MSPSPYSYKLSSSSPLSPPFLIFFFFLMIRPPPRSTPFPYTTLFRSPPDRKWLRAGVMEDGIVTVSERGTGQGAVISPLLANIYLHYVLDLWAVRWRQREATGDMIIVRYADDFIIGFQHESDARHFLDEMRERLQKFALTLHPEKTRLIEFGRFAAERRQRRGLGKPETFNFLGFTFICGKTRAGKFQIKRKTRRDRMRAKLKMVPEEMRRRMHRPIPDHGEG